jgi:hypothetical protein
LKVKNWFQSLPFKWVKLVPLRHAGCEKVRPEQVRRDVSVSTYDERKMGQGREMFDTNGGGIQRQCVQRGKMTVREEKCTAAGGGNQEATWLVVVVGVRQRNEWNE